MRHPHLVLAIAASAVLSGSLAAAAPAKRDRAAVHKKRRARHVKPAVEAEAETAETRPRTDKTETARVALSEAIDAPLSAEPSEELLVDAPVVHAKAAPRDDWHVAIGPYAWIPAVDTKVAVGGASVSGGADFVKTVTHARYGIEALGELDYGRWSLSGDVLYGVLGLDGGTSVGPVMLTVSGEVSSVLVDGVAGYRIVGDDRSVFALDARLGLRYQRTTINAAVGVLGSELGTPGSVDAGREVLAGTRATLRPASWLSLTGAGDVGVYGTWVSTWSVTADANFKITSHVLLSVGYRTLTIDEGPVAVGLHGPRAAAQVVF